MQCIFVPPFLPAQHHSRTSPFVAIDTRQTLPLLAADNAVISLPPSLCTAGHLYHVHVQIFALIAIKAHCSMCSYTKRFKRALLNRLLVWPNLISTYWFRILCLSFSWLVRLVSYSVL